MNRYDDARRVFAILSQLLVEVRLVADVPNLAGLSLTTANLDGLPLIGLRESPHFGLNIVVKRAMDMVLSLIGLLLLSPLFALLALLVKLTSPGPIFYRQERCGLNGKTFSHAEIPQHAGRFREQDGAGVGEEERQPQHAARRVSCARRASTNCRSSGTC